MANLHCHTSDIKSKREQEIYKVTVIGSIGNLALVIFKFIAAIVGHSAAMLADAVHSLSDFLTDLVVLIVVKISSKPSDKTHEFGHGKFETLGTAIIAIVLFGAGLGILSGGIKEIIKFYRGEPISAPGMIALWAALISIVIKECLYRYTIKVAKKVDSKAVEANAWDHRSDAMSSLGTTLGIAGAILLGPHWRVLDPIAAVIVSIFILRISLKLFKPCLDELMERSLPKEQEKLVYDAISKFPEISDPHNLRTRRIGSYAAVDIHVRMDPDMTVKQSHEITRQLERHIKSSLGPDTYVSIHVEPAASL